MSPTDVDRWQRAEQVFAAAIECPREERDELLRRACDGDDALRQAVETLLAFDDADFLEAALVSPAFLASPLAAAPQLGETIGPYRLIQVIGEGGTSRVFLAERTQGGFAQNVAVKLIREGRVNAVMLRRFRRERAILAELQHPNVARLLDGGATSQGEPYVVMEHVPGLPVTRYCDERRASVARRLEIFRGVCSAVQHAHTHLVIHGDIKPSNVLVTEAGEPKLLDFGIAQRLWRRASTPGEEHTATGERALTPGYASPEQRAGLPLTTATDIYSLGVVLHELLVGRRPTTSYEAHHAPTERQPPSACLASDDPATRAEIESAARARDTTRRQLRGLIAGDLDQIVLRAMADAPAARYVSVEQLSDDVARYQAGLPVVARRQRLWYRARKFARRNALAVALGAAAALCLLALAGVLAHQGARVRRERDAARQAQARAEDVTRFLVDAFDVADPYSTRGASVTARDVLDRAAKRIELSLAREPALQAELMTTMGRVYANLGLRAAARGQLEAAHAIRQRLYGERSAEAAETLTQLGLLSHDEGNDIAAEAAWRSALEIRRTLFGPEDLRVAESLAPLGYLLRDRGEHAAAEPLIRQALAIKRRHLGDDHVEVAAALTQLALLLQQKGALDEAEALGLEAVATFRRSQQDDARAADALATLAWLKDLKGDGAAAEALYRQALAMRRRVFGERHPAVATALVELASVLRTRGDYEGAEQAARRALELNRELMPAGHPDLATSLTNLAMILRDKGHADAAEPLLVEALDLARSALGPKDPDVAAHGHNLAAVLFALGRYAAADKASGDALAIRRERLGPAHWQVGNTLALRADLLLAMGRGEEARATAARALEILEAALPAGHWRTAVARSILGDCLSAQGRVDEARALVVPSVATIRRAQGPAGYETRRALARMARVEARVERTRNTTARAPLGSQVLVTEAGTGGAARGAR